jgi:hypothetical protein
MRGGSSPASSSRLGGELKTLPLGEVSRRRVFVIALSGIQENRNPLARNSEEFCDPSGRETFLMECKDLGTPQSMAEIMQDHEVLRENLNE